MPLGDEGQRLGEEPGTVRRNEHEPLQNYPVFEQVFVELGVVESMVTRQEGAVWVVLPMSGVLHPRLLDSRVAIPTVAPDPDPRRSRGRW